MLLQETGTLDEAAPLLEKSAALFGEFDDESHAAQAYLYAGMAYQDLERADTVVRSLYNQASLLALSSLEAAAEARDIVESRHVETFREAVTEYYNSIFGRLGRL